MARKSYADDMEQQETQQPGGKSKKAAAADKPSKTQDAFEFLYRFLYYVGIQVLRSLRRKKKFIQKKLLRIYWFAKIQRHSLTEKGSRTLRRTVWAITGPFVRIQESYGVYKNNIQNLSSSLTPKERRKACWREFEDTTLQLLVRYIKDILNFAGPVVALLVLIVTIQYYRSIEFVLAVEYNGEYIGEIADESVFEQAEQEVRKRIIHEEYIQPQSNTPTFRIVRKKSDELVDVNALTDALISASGNKLVEAAGFYVDGSFLGAVEDGDQLIDMLQKVKDQQSTGAENETIAFVKDIKLVNGLFPVTSLTQVSEIEKDITKEITAQRTYVVQEGDSPWTIAENMDVPLSAILNLNPGIEESLMIGEEILVSKAEPFLATQVIRTQVYEEEIAFAINKTQDSTMSMGTSKITQEGKPGRRQITEQVTLINGLEVDRKVLDSTILEEPVTQELTVGTMRPIQYVQQATGGSVDGFISPLPGGYVSCGYWGYYGHTGIDLVRGSATYGSPVVASAAGTVEAAGWGGAYGYQVVINHGGGVKTRYAHNSVLMVSVGQYVEQGQQIAAAGRTGRVTGPHCHFEIIVNGSFKNPASYIF